MRGDARKLTQRGMLSDMGFGGRGSPGARARLPLDVDRSVRRYLQLADRLLPGRVVGFHLVGSVALGAYRRGRSDIDFVATVDGDLAEADLRRVRMVQVGAGARTAARAVAARQFALPGTCNGVYVRADDLPRPVSEIVPVASHVGHDFQAGTGFDVNPVQWTTLARHGVAVRGPEPARLGLDPQPELLRQWNLDNLAGYWVPWAEATHRRVGGRWRAIPRWSTAWGVQGPPRLLHTIATGDVISKEEAAERSTTYLDPVHHPIVAEGLAWWRDEPADPRFADVGVRAAATADAVLAVAEAARAL